ncbi:hypothetical protein [Limimaricola cinnabarinus]|uniref:Uncharacterized protein n=1 Tax=Limimaricola cinnabarinus LL-001 TaxID=1337093 RepID=U2Z2R2_9RHOB|nr:hypothetical protein [Limimaricola cinnabarinus]GAD55332.1 hypothetical protein MBELCI_1384 [Limimaricola cinnabarinus LL-001]
MSDLTIKDLGMPATSEPVRVAARRLRWFRAAFRAAVQRVSVETGLRFEVDDAKLASGFVHWLRVVERGHPHDRAARPAYFSHAAGMMLRLLLKEAPLTVVGGPPDVDPQRPEYFWPEGYCCTVFCLNVYALAVRQEFGRDAALGVDFDDLGIWWSFKENAHHNSAYAIAFFKLFAGVDPSWEFPDSFQWPKGALEGPIPVRPLG